MPYQVTLNAKIAAVCLLLGSIVLHGFNQIAVDLVPLRLIGFGILVLGAWAFSDEMGLRKPLNRAAFVSFVFAIAAISATAIDGSQAQGKYFLVYAFALLFAMLLWSGAFMHRQRDVKLAGAIGVLASALPIIVLIVGHISVGAGAYLGVNALVEVGSNANVLTSNAVKSIEAFFIVWAFIAATLLWRGKIQASYI